MLNVCTLNLSSRYVSLAAISMDNFSTTQNLITSSLMVESVKGLFIFYWYSTLSPDMVLHIWCIVWYCPDILLRVWHGLLIYDMYVYRVTWYMAYSRENKMCKIRYFCANVQRKASAKNVDIAIVKPMASRDSIP